MATIFLSIDKEITDKSETICQGADNQKAAIDEGFINERSDEKPFPDPKQTA